MKKVFERFCRGLKEVEKHIEENGHGFMWSKRLGYILTCPSNLGTGLRAGKSYPCQIFKYLRSKTFLLIINYSDTNFIFIVSRRSRQTS